MARRAATAAARSAAPARAPARPQRLEPRRQPRRAAPPRRRSGPARVASLPLRIARAPVSRSLRARAAGVADSLLRGHGWIALIAALLVGIVFFNVDLLQMNRDIAQTADRAAAVKSENARLKLRLARLGSTERIQLAALQRGLVLPAPGQIRYLRANGASDGRRAARQISPPASGQGLAAAPATAAPPPASQPTLVQRQPAAAQPQPAQPQATHLQATQRRSTQPQQPQTTRQQQSVPQATAPTGAQAAP